MAAVRIYFQYDPNDPDSYEREKSKALYKTIFAMFSFMGIIYALIVILTTLFDCVKGQYVNNYVLSELSQVFGLLALSSIIMFVSITSGKQMRIVVFPRFLIYFYGTFFGLCGIIGFIASMLSEIKSQVLLVGSLVWIVIIALCMILLIKRIRKKEEEGIPSVLERLDSYFVEKKRDKEINKRIKELDKYIAKLQKEEDEAN